MLPIFHYANLSTLLFLFYWDISYSCMRDRSTVLGTKPENHTMFVDNKKNGLMRNLFYNCQLFLGGFVVVDDHMQQLLLCWCVKLRFNDDDSISITKFPYEGLSGFFYTAVTRSSSSTVGVRWCQPLNSRWNNPTTRNKCIHFSYFFHHHLQQFFQFYAS